MILTVTATVTVTYSDSDSDSNINSDILERFRFYYDHDVKFICKGVPYSTSSDDKSSGFTFARDKLSNIASISSGRYSITNNREYNRVYFNKAMCYLKKQGHI